MARGDGRRMCEPGKQARRRGEWGRDEQGCDVDWEEDEGREDDEYFGGFADEELGLLLEGEDAGNVDDLCDLFEDLEDSVLDGQTSSDDNASSVDLEATKEDEDDAAKVDDVAALFGDLEQVFAEEDGDWLAALDVDDMAAAFDELLQAEAKVEASPSPLPLPLTVEARVLVPSFTVRMEGRPTRLGAEAIDAHAFLTGPPVLAKRKVSAIEPYSARIPDPALAQTRRACAAKRRRINGRFTVEKAPFVAITKLQPETRTHET